MAPWFSEACREARNTYKQCKKQQGREHHKTVTAYSAFRKICKKARTQFQYLLPDMLKYSPKSFWSMLKPAKCNNSDIPTAAIAELNK